MWRVNMKRKHQSGQAILQYIIIIALVAVAALTVLGLFSDRIRALISGSTKAIGGQSEDPVESSLDNMRNMDANGDNVTF